MKYIISNLKLGLADDKAHLRKIAAKKLAVKESDILFFRIAKESIDARKKNNITFVYSVMVEIDGKAKNTDKDIRELEDKKEEVIAFGNKKVVNRPVIVGMGPCGLFAGLFLAQSGFSPLLIERGEDVHSRSKTVNDFWKNGKLAQESNVQFGEGGAGTFSDGKLTTRINDRECDLVLEILKECGAPSDILYKAKPHIGSDNLPKVVENLREKIKAFGGQVLFNTKLTDIEIKDGEISSITVNDRERIETNLVVLAIGHSSRDTFQMLFNRGITLEPKPFSIGVRIEHPQEFINRAQYGEQYKHSNLFAADYQLFQKIQNRTAYSFCMCPGGLVVASASEENTIVTNGMSEYSRDRENANSAFVVSVEPSDFGGTGPLAGIEFQRKYEKLAFEIGGKSYGAPIQKLSDFINGQKSQKLGLVKPSYTGETTLADLNLCMPKFVGDTLKEAVGHFDRRLRGFGMGDALLTGMETRTSSPVRILRDERFEAVHAEGLFPAGEGAGYAGGITSAAVDGIKTAYRIMAKYGQKDI